MLANAGKIFALVGFVALAFPQPALARDFAEIYTDCGIGAMIAPSNDAVATVTNVTWDLGTTAISSNISSPDACVGGKARLASFIHNSYDDLERNLASGSGSHLDALIVLAGYDVRTEKDRQARVETLRDGFAGIVADPGYTEKNRYEKAKALYDLVSEQVSETA